MKQYSDDRKAMVLEIMETLKTRGHWVPKEFEGPDLIMAVGKALDSMVLQLDQARKDRDLLIEVIRDLRSTLGWIRAASSVRDPEVAEVARKTLGAEPWPAEKRKCETCGGDGRIGKRISALVSEQRDCPDCTKSKCGVCGAEVGGNFPAIKDAWDEECEWYVCVGCRPKHTH